MFHLNESKRITHTSQWTTEFELKFQGTMGTIRISNIKFFITDTPYNMYYLSFKYVFFYDLKQFLKNNFSCFSEVDLGSIFHNLKL